MADRGDAQRRERMARNEALFREVNERLEELAQAFHDVSRGAVFTCECGDLECTEQVEMSLDEYEAVRASGDQFLVLPGHVYPEIERVVRENDRFVVVAKVGDAADVVEREDPRS